MPRKPKLDSLSTAELLAAVEVPVLDPQAEFNKWLITQNIHPGNTVCPASRLYEDYLDWRRQHPKYIGDPLNVTEWGQLMSGRFRKGRRKFGNVYYTSRRSNTAAGHDRPVRRVKSET